MILAGHRYNAGLDIVLVGPVARGASIFENLLAPQKTYWPPKKLTGPYLKTKLARRKTICINLQFAHRPIIKLFRSHPRNIFQIWMVILKKTPQKCVRASGHIANVKPCNGRLGAYPGTINEKHQTYATEKLLNVKKNTKKLHFLIISSWSFTRRQRYDSWWRSIMCF